MDNFLGVQVKLRHLIDDAQAKGEMWTRDWDKAPFPLSEAAAVKPARVVTASVGKGRGSRCSFCSLSADSASSCTMHFQASQASSSLKEQTQPHTVDQVSKMLMQFQTFLVAACMLLHNPGALEVVAAIYIC